VPYVESLGVRGIPIQTNLHAIWHVESIKALQTIGLWVWTSSHSHSQPNSIAKLRFGPFKLITSESRLSIANLYPPNPQKKPFSGAHLRPWPGHDFAFAGIDWESRDLTHHASPATFFVANKSVSLRAELQIPRWQWKIFKSFCLRGRWKVKELFVCQDKFTKTRIYLEQ